MELWSAGNLVDSDAPIIDGTITDKYVTGLRRTLTMTVPPSWDKWLDLPFLEARPYSGLSWGNSEFLCPMGRFPFMRPTTTLPAKGISITADDYWQRVVLDDFLYTIPSYSRMHVSLAVATLMAEVGIAFTPDNANLTSDPMVPALLWDKSRADTIAGLLASVGAEAFVDREGQGIVRDRTVTSFARPLSDGVNGTLITVSSAPNWSQVFNAVSAASSNQDVHFDPVVVAIDDPAHPAHYYWIGARSKRYTSPLLMDRAQAFLAARSILEKSSAAALNWQVTCVPDPSRDAGDAVVVTCDFGTVTAVIQEVTHPLGAGVQSMTLGAL